MTDRIIVHETDPQILESVFPTPGRNEPCHCGSGEKYKRCCVSKDDEAWRTVARLSREADAVLETVRAMPKSIYQEYNP